MRHTLSSIGLAIALVLASFGLAAPALAQGAPIDGYCAQISEQDKYASDGFALTDAGSILRQDRANFHRFGTADEMDYGDATFGSTKAREAIPAMLERGDIDPSVARAIVRDYPYICVDIYPRALSVYLDSNEGEPEYDDAGYPFIGSWDCEVGVFSFSSEFYNNGSEDLAILEIQEGSDGSWTLLFEDDYFITLSGFTGTQMGWFSGASGDNFNCTRLD